MIRYVFVLVFALLATTARSQDYLLKQEIPFSTYRVWIDFKNNTPVQKGFLTNLSDSSVFIKPTIRNLPNRSPVELKVRDIATIKAHNQNQVLLGGLCAGAAGLIVGRAIAVFTRNSIDDTLLPFVIAIPAVPAGAFLGAFKVKIPINGSQTVYEKKKKKLRKYIEPQYK